MGPTPYGQPEPFQPGVGPGPVVRPKPRSNRRFLPVVVAAVVAIVAFAGGYEVANATASKTAAGANGFGDANGQGFVPGASGRPRGGSGGGGGNFGGGASGTVGSVAADQMTITTQTGGSRIVLLTPTTTVTKVTSATQAITDLTSGETVTVIGTANPDGSVTATRVVIGDIGVLGGRGAGAGQTPAASATP